VLRLRSMILGDPKIGWRERYGAEGTEEVVGPGAEGGSGPGADADNVFGPGDPSGA
jgi:hypothetical protein